MDACSYASSSSFRTGEPPVPNDVTIEIFAFMDAALHSKDRGGAVVKLR